MSQNLKLSDMFSKAGAVIKPKHDFLGLFTEEGACKASETGIYKSNAGGRLTLTSGIWRLQNYVTKIAYTSGSVVNVLRSSGSGVSDSGTGTQKS